MMIVNVIQGTTAGHSPSACPSRMVRLQCRAIIQCRKGVRALATARGTPCRMSAAGGLEEHTSKYPRSQVRRRSSALTSTSLSTSSYAGVNSSGELLRLPATEQGAQPLSRQELRALMEAEGGLQAMPPRQLVEWLDRWTELDDAVLCPEVKKVAAPELRQAMAQALALVGTQAAGWSPGLCSQLLFALGRVAYVWEPCERQQLRQLTSLLTPLAVGEEGRGLRKMGPSELSRLSFGLGQLEQRQAVDVLRDIEAECLRRGLTKFRPRDLTDLLYGFVGMRQRPSAPLLEAIEERVGRRGYLKGRNGDTAPGDVVRLLRVLSMVHTPSEALLEAGARMCSDPTFRQQLETRQLAGALYVYSMLDFPDKMAQMSHMLHELEERTGGLHRGDVPHYVVARVAGAIQRSLDWVEGREALRRILDQLQADESGAGWSVQLLSLMVRSAVDSNLHGEYGPLVARLVHELATQGFSTFSQAVHIPNTLRLLRMLSVDPGPATLEDAVREYLRRGSEGEEGPEGPTTGELRSLGHMMVEARHAHDEHGYTVPGALLDHMFRRCELADTADGVQVYTLGRSIKLAGDVCTRHAGSPLAHDHSGLLRLMQSLLVGQRAEALMAHDGATRGGLLGSLRRLCKDADSRGQGGKTMVRAFDTLLWDHYLATLARDAGEGEAWLGRLSCMELELLTEGITWDHISLGNVTTAQALAKVVAQVLTRPLEQYPPEMEVVLLDCLLRLKAKGWAGVVGRFKESVAGVLESVHMRGLTRGTWSSRPSSLLFVLRALACLKTPVPPGLVPAVLEAVGHLGLLCFTPMQLGQLLGYVHSLGNEPLPQWLQDEMLARLCSPTARAHMDASTVLVVLNGLALTGLRPDEASLSSLISSLDPAALEPLPLVNTATLLYSLAALRVQPSVEVWEHATQRLCAPVGHAPFTHARKLVKSTHHRALDLLPALASFDLPAPPRLLDTLAAAALVLQVPTLRHPEFVPRIRLVLQGYATLRHLPFDKQVMRQLVDGLAGAMVSTKMKGFDAMDVAQCLWLFSKYQLSPSRGFMQAVVHTYLHGHDNRLLEPTPASVPLLLRGMAGLSQTCRKTTMLKDEPPRLVAQQLNALLYPHGDTCTSQQVWWSLHSAGLLTLVVGSAPTVGRLWGLFHTRLGFEGLSAPALRCLVRSTLKHDMHPGKQLVARLGQACREQGMANVVETMAVKYGAIEGHTAREESEAQGRMIKDGRKWVEDHPEGRRFLLELLASCRIGEGQHIEPSLKGIRGTNP